MTYLAVPISGKDLESCKEQIQASVKAGAQMLELRTDYIESLNTEKLAQLIADAKQTALPIIVTCRDSAQGGMNNLSSDIRKKILTEAIKLGADLIDCEYANFIKKDFAERIKQALAQNSKTKLILSAHNFKGPFKNLSGTYEEIFTACPDAIAKTAYHAKHINDCFESFDIIEKYGKKVIALCMGPNGTISRIIAKKLRAFLTFASIADKAATAAGQLTIEEMKTRYRFDKISNKTEFFGLIGDPVGHSIGPVVHNACFDAEKLNKVYLPLLVEGGQIEFNEFLDNVITRNYLGLRGFSVTIPHKRNALEYARTKGEYIEPLAVSIGAVNTMVIGVNERISCYNTDYAGAMDALTQTLGINRKNLNGKVVSVVGAGGAARAIVAGLADVGAKVTIYNRTVSKAHNLALEFGCHYAGLDKIEKLDADIIINCTSIGMHPKVDATVVPAHLLKSSMTVFDTVYNPMETLLLKQAKEAGAKLVNGAEMFIGQAAEQFRLFTHKDCPMQTIRQTVLAALAKK
ncbi:MAG: shikimate dehydrogenase [Sedimentisphaerales bacterium]|nr:shikimate dehydrogenase [Sedimentisphaerales bacterium]